MDRAFWFEYGTLIEDALLYVVIAVAACCICKIVYDWKEDRRLRKEMAERLQEQETQE